jgi:aspartate aminotransferase/aminotransferase
MQFRPELAEMGEATSIKINQYVYDLKRKGLDVITLSLGEAFFDIPLFDFGKLDLAKCYHYADSQGIPELRAKIAEYYGKLYGAPVDAKDEVLITAGSKPAIFLAMLAALRPGDEVYMHEPCWLSYPDQARMVGVTPRFLPYTADPAEFDQLMSPKARMLILNNPNNPAGRTYSEAELRSIYERCRARGIYLMVDEAYSDFVLDNSFHSMAKLVPDKDGVIVVNSLSKNFGMSGWRLGYVISSPDFIRVLLKANQHVITCAPSILMYYAARYFDDIISITLPQVQLVTEKRARVAEMIDELGMNCLAGTSTFYFFIDIGAYAGTSADFAITLLAEQMISVVPGSAYGESTDRFIRLGIGAESEERIWEALNLIRALAATTDPQTVRLRAERARARLEPKQAAKGH